MKKQFSIFILLCFVQIVFAQKVLNTQPISLFNGKDFEGWHFDIPAMDEKPKFTPYFPTKPKGKNPFYVKDGMLSTLAKPWGHIITDKSYQNYRLTVEYRYSEEAKNSGVLVHVSEPRYFIKAFPKSIECQMMHQSAGDFFCLGESLEIPPSEISESTKKSGKKSERIHKLIDFKSIAIAKLTDAEKPSGEWNTYVVECFGNEIKIWLNGTLVNHGVNASVSSGQIALQAEGSAVDFRKVELQPISELSN